MSERVSFFMFLLWLSYLVVSGILMFSRGFLLTRVSRKEVSICEPYSKIPCNPQEASQVNITNGHEFYCTEADRLSSLLRDVNGSAAYCLPRRSRVVLVVIDALKYDFCEYNASISEPLAYQNKLPVIHRLLESRPNNTRLLKFIADPPTTTLQRLKGLTTGSLPTFIDAGSNFATPEINEDNIIDQLISHDGKAVLLGDDTWESLYVNRWTRSVALPSFNTWDLDTVDNAINEKLDGELRKRDWSLLVAHYLGVDHCGHRHGPFHEEMSRKLTEMNNVIEKVVNTVDEDTMLFVIGDHGMTATGDHGGESEAEVTAGMFVYSPWTLMSPNEPLSPKSVRQVDIVPTISAILGIPIPFSNLGTIILNALPHVGPPTSPLRDWQFALMNMWANVKQVTNYIQQYAETSDQFTQDSLENIAKKFTILSYRVQSIYNTHAFHSFATDAREFLIDVRSMCQEVWIQFDSYSMSRGLLLVILTVFFTYVIVDGIPPERLPEIFRSSFLWCAYGAMALTATVALIGHAFYLVENLELTILFSTGMVSIFMLAILVIQNWEFIAQNWYEISKRKGWLDSVARTILILSSLALFSNSYIVEEAAVTAFLFLTLLFIVAFTGRLPKVLFPAYFACAAFVVYSRNYLSCREEQGYCYVKTVDNQQVKSSDLMVAMLSLALLVAMSRLWLRSCGNLVSTATAVWRYGPPVVAVCIGGHWVSSWGPFKLQSKADQLARVVYGGVAFIIVAVLLRPLSLYLMPTHKTTLSVNESSNLIPQVFNELKLAFRGFGNAQRNRDPGDEGELPVVCGLATVYSAVYVTLSTCVTLLIAMLLGVNAAPSAFLMYACGTLTIAIIAVVRYQRATSLAQLLSLDTWGTQLWILLGLYFFYASGHHASLSSIRWNAAFVGTGGKFIHNIIPTTLIIINTFGSNIIMGLCVPLLVICPFPLYAMWGHTSRINLQRGELIIYEKERLFMTGVFNGSAKYIMFLSVRMFICMLSATIHCRHLMVWKIFAPKLIFEGIGMFVSVASVLLSNLLLLRIHSSLEEFLTKITKSS